MGCAASTATVVSVQDNESNVISLEEASKTGRSPQTAATPATAPPPLLDFNGVMASGAGQKAMLAFAKSEHSEENMEFWLEIQRFNELEDKDARKEFADTIIERHLQKDAPKLVNIPAKMIHKFTGDPIQGETKGSFSYDDPDLFTEAEGEIFTLLRKDTFKRFQASKEAIALGEEIIRSSEGLSMLLVSGFPAKKADE